MTNNAKTVEEYIAELSDDRKEAIVNLRKIISENLPKGFEEQMSYGMIGLQFRKSIYERLSLFLELPLPFRVLASQKNSINIYHMGIYADEKLLKWFQEEFPKYSKKLDMGNLV